MFDIVYVNGRYVHRRFASIPISDRGFQFADGVYELIALYQGRLISLDAHKQRLERSLSSIGIPAPRSRQSLSLIIGETIRRNQTRDALVYIQISRGNAPRNHVPPQSGIVPSLVVALYPPLGLPLGNLDALADQGVRVVTVDDIRWQRCDIKGTALIANVLAKTQAVRQQAFEAWLVYQGHIREGATSNAWIVDAQGRLRTCPEDGKILAGIARQTIFNLAHEMKMDILLKAFSHDDIASAREAFLSSSSCFMLPVVEVDGHAVHGGKPGPITRALRAAYITTLRRAIQVEDLWRIPSTHVA